MHLCLSMYRIGLCTYYFINSLANKLILQIILQGLIFIYKVQSHIKYNDDESRFRRSITPIQFTNNN